MNISAWCSLHLSSLLEAASQANTATEPEGFRKMVYPRDKKVRSDAINIHALLIITTVGLVVAY